MIILSMVIFSGILEVCSAEDTARSTVTTPRYSTNSTVRAQISASTTSFSRPTETLYHVLSVQPDVYSTPTILPCWSKATNRSGRIELRKGDFAGPHGRRELCFQLAACPGKTDFGPSWPRIDVAEDLFITMSVGKLQRNEYIRLNSSRATLTDTAHEDDYSVFSAYLLQSWTKGHVLLMDATPYVEWSMGAAFTVKYDTLPSYSAAREQLLSKEEGDRATDRQISGTDFGNGTLITIDYTVVLRPRNAFSRFQADLWFYNHPCNPEMFYCPSLLGFLPKQLCSHSSGNDQNISSCPLFAFSPAQPNNSLAANRPGECLSAGSALRDLALSVYSDTTSGSAHNSTRRPHYPYRGDSDRPFAFHEIVLLTLGAGLIVCCFLCAGLRYCLCWKPARNPTVISASRDSSRRASESQPTVFGASAASLEGAGRPLTDNPPAYEEVFQPFGKSSSQPPSYSRCAANDDTSAGRPPLYIISSPIQIPMNHLARNPTFDLS